MLRRIVITINGENDPEVEEAIDSLEEEVGDLVDSLVYEFSEYGVTGEVS